jgi:hypothetical protein
MNVTSTINGSSVTVVEIIPNGNQIYLAYIDASANLKVDRLFLSGSGTIIGTSSTVN